jgi:geranylgeranyl diphosphate synthase type I
MATDVEWTSALPFAVAVELVHSFSLVHDDVQDRGAERRGRPSVWAKWGEAQAINVGDYLFAAAHSAALRDPGLPAESRLRGVGTLIDACMALSRGQHLDMAFERRDDVTVDDYLEMVRGKTAALLGAACELGAIAGGVQRAERQLFRAFGEHLGMAFQVRDDLLGIWGDPAVMGKPAADIADRKKTLPILLGVQRSPEVRDRIARGCADDVWRVVALLEETGAFQESRTRMLAHAAAALDVLDAVVPPGMARDALVGLVEKATDVTSLAIAGRSVAAA